jgi:cytochrome c556
VRHIVKIIGFTVSTIVLSITLLPMGLSHAVSGEEAIKARVHFMKNDIYDHFKVLAAFSKKGVGTLADVESNAMALAELAKEIETHFPKDTGRGNYPDKVTRALPAIWKDWDGFKKDIQRLADQSSKLAHLAKEGNKDAVVNFIGKSGKYSKTQIGCAECHESFQGPKVKK